MELAGIFHILQTSAMQEYKDVTTTRRYYFHCPFSWSLRQQEQSLIKPLRIPRVFISLLRCEQHGSHAGQRVLYNERVFINRLLLLLCAMSSDECGRIARIRTCLARSACWPFSSRILSLVCRFADDVELVKSDFPSGDRGACSMPSKPAQLNVG